MSKASTKPKKVEPPEDSVGLRVVACGIAVLCIVTACLYVNSPSLLIFFYLWSALTGSYVSYQFRNKKTFWLSWITSAGLLIVLGNFLEELVFQYSAGKVQALVPFIHVLTGLQALHTFDLRAKSDINVSALIGLGLFACTAAIARDLLFAYITLGYISLAASLLYYESVSRTRSAGAIGTSSENTELAALRERSLNTRVPRGNAFLPLCLLPLMSVLVFLALPRVESFFDLLMNNMRRAQNGEQLNLSWIKASNGLSTLGTIPGLGGLPKSMGGTGTGQTSVATGTAIGATGVGISMDGTGTAGGAPGATGSSQQKGEGNKTTKGGEKVKSKAGKHKERQDNEMVFRNKETAEHDEDLVMRVTTSRDTYFRRICFDKYDGKHWSVSSEGTVSKCAKENSAYQELAGVPALFVQPGLHSAQLSQDITVELDIGHAIPTASIPQQIDFPNDPVLVDQFGILRTKKPIIAGTHYRVVSQVADYDVDQMRKAPVDDAKLTRLTNEMKSYLQLPADLSPEVVSLARSIAGNDGNWFTRAERICNYLRTNYTYTLDLNDADNKEEVAAHFLLKSKQGACGPFSTSFVVMCRAAGIPARCIGGFSPGDFNAQTGIHEIKNKHGHAWGEVFVPNYDWIPFDATPTGTLPKPTEEDHSIIGSIKKSIKNVQDQFANKPEAPPPPPPIAPSPDQAKTKQAEQKGSASTKPGTKSGVAKSQQPKKTDKKDNRAVPAPPKPVEKPKPIDWHELILLIIVIPATMLFLQAMLQAIKQARLAAKKKPLEKPKSSTVLFLKVANDLKKVKINRLPSDTPEDLLSRFSETLDPSVQIHPELPGLCKRFMELYSADRFGCDDAAELRGGQMKQISEQIHTLVRTRHHDNN